MDKKISISYKTFFITAGIYLLLPVLIFFLGYLKLMIALPLTAVSIFLFVLAAMGSEGGKIELPVNFFIVTAIFAVIVTILTGVGELVWSTYDHAFRRAILNDLITYKWPVIYDPATQTIPEVIMQLRSSEDQGFIYYFVYWLPSALVGKVFGFTAANVFLILWNSFGLCLIVTGMTMFIGRVSYACHFLLVCFSGLDIIPYFINELFLQIDEQWMWVDGCVPHMSFISNFNNLENVYQQAVPCYLIITLLLLMKDRRCVGFIGSLLFAYSPWATIGMIVICGVKILATKGRVKDIFTLTNLVMPVIMAFVFGSFYMSQSGAMSEQGLTAGFYDNPLMFILAYLILLAVEVLPAAALTFTSRKRDPMYWGAIVLLLICPLYKITESNDLTMRASMPALFILCVFLSGVVADFVKEIVALSMEKGKQIEPKVFLRTIAVSVTVLGMGFVSMYMLSVIIPATIMGEERPEKDIVSFGQQSTPYYTAKIEDQFFADKPEDKFFFKYLAK